MAAMASRRTRSVSAITASSSLSSPDTTCILKALICKFYLQLGGQVFCFLFGAGNKVLLFLDALLGCPDLSLEVL
jgi:hypothetical protein